MKRFDESRGLGSCRKGEGAEVIRLPVRDLKREVEQEFREAQRVGR